MIFDWLFSLFKNKKIKEAIAPIFIHVPTREDLIKEGKTKELELLDQYKKEYKDKLNKRLLFGDISSENLSKKYLANQDIIIKHIMSNNYTGINEILASGNTEELLEAKLEYLKLYILNEENNKIHNEMLLRYMALTEIKKKSYFIRPTQRRAISNELDFLHSSLVVCKSNNFATNTDCKLYLIRMNEINKYINNLSVEETTLLNDRKKLVMKLANTFIKDKYDSILSSNMSDLGIVSYLEIELEKYYLKHRKKLDLLDDELFKFSRQIITRDNKDALLKQIEIFETKYQLVNMFNKVPKDSFERLYTIKFDILTCDISIFDEPVISKEDRGYEYYKSIVKDKLSGNFYFYSIDEVLNNMEKLAALLSFDRENGFNDLLNNTLIRKDDLNKIALLVGSTNLEYYKTLFNGNDGIEWNEYISLKSVLEVIRRYQASGDYGLLTVLYDYSNLKYSSNQLPEGIVKFAPSFDSDYDRQSIFGSHYFEIRLPKTIKEFDGSNIGIYYVTELPYGIEKVSFNIDQNIPPIPPTVNEITLLNTDSNIKKEKFVLKFLDFKNSALLKSPEMVSKLLCSLPDREIYIELEDRGEIFTYWMGNSIIPEYGIRHADPYLFFVSNGDVHNSFVQHIINETGYNIFTGETKPWLRKTKKRRW